MPGLQFVSILHSRRFPHYANVSIFVTDLERPICNCRSGNVEEVDYIAADYNQLQKLGVMTFSPR